MLHRPVLSVVVVVYDMPRQALNTIESLSPAHQGVDGRDYEIVVVENHSAATLTPEQVRQAAPNARHLLRRESGSSPAPALNAGAEAARGRLLALMVDGARMVTPGVVAGLMTARRIAAEPVVSVPGYHLGERLHQDAVRHGYGAQEEQEALQALRWREDGYRLFDMAVPSASCSGGFLQPIGESNCIGVSKALFQRLGGFDEAFTTSGGGFVNLDFYRRAVDAGTLILLPGEGTFHQFHGGATTGAPGVDRDRLLDEMRAEYERLRGHAHRPPQQSPTLLGRIPPSAVRFLGSSVISWQEVHRP
jgi:glycosyltransferase involved in cell wall biosynthesis